MRALLLFSLLTSLVFADECKIKSREEILASVSKVEAFVKKLMSEKDVPGLSVAFFKGREILFEKVYGDGLKNPLFQAASISKPVAAFGALKGVQKKLLEIDKPMNQFVSKPWLPAQEFVDLVTLRTLLNHTSGLSNDPMGEDRKLYFKPGEKFSYSGGGFVYMQQAIEDSSKKSLETYMRPTLDSLGMKQSTYDLTYEGETYMNAAFSLQTTPHELSSFMMELAQPHAENAWAVQAMATPTVDVEKDVRWGLGIGLISCGSETGFHHTGRNFSYHHSVTVVFNKSQVGAVVMARGKDSRGIPTEIANMAIDGGL